MKLEARERNKGAVVEKSKILVILMTPVRLNMKVLDDQLGMIVH